MTTHDDLVDTVAALAVGALSRSEAEDALAHLAECAACRNEYRALSHGADVVGASAEAAPGLLPPDRSARLKDRILRDATTLRAPVARSAPFDSMVPKDRLVEYAPGASWAVLSIEGMTLVYWVFEPPACSELPEELHPHAQAGVVLEGSMTLHYENGVEVLCERGDVYAIAPGTVHGASFTERTVLFDVYAPNHEEFERLYRATRGD